MAIYELFSRPIDVKYKASLCSRITWFYIFTVLLKFICPFLLAYFSQGFWRKVDFYREQPNVSFKHQILIVLEAKPPGELIFWSTYENINKIMKQDVFQSLPDIEHREEDFNKDGKKDELEMVINFPLSKQEIISAKIILIFDYKLSIFSHLHMESAAFVHHSAFPGSELNVIGDLSLNQREPLKHSGTDERFNISVIGESFLKPPTSLEDILYEYFKRNITTAVTNAYPVWKIANPKSNSFKIHIHLRYPIETILYRVGFWQLLKWALVQYVAAYIVISYIIHFIRKCVFQKHIFPSIVIDPLKQKI